MVEIKLYILGGTVTRVCVCPYDEAKVESVHRELAAGWSQVVHCRQITRTRRPSEMSHRRYESRGHTMKARWQPDRGDVRSDDSSLQSLGVCWCRARFDCVSRSHGRRDGAVVVVGRRRSNGSCDRACAVNEHITVHRERISRRRPVL